MSNTAERHGLTASDRIEIKNLISEFNVHEDTGDAEAWAALFTIDGSMTGLGKKPVVGRDNLTELARKRWAEKPHAKNRAHWVCNVLIGETEQGVTAESYQMSIDKADGGHKIVSITIKADELRREDGRWRFQARNVLPLGNL